MPQLIRQQCDVSTGLDPQFDNTEYVLPNCFPSPPLLTGVSVHMGYEPISEEEAFLHPVSEDSLPASRFTLPRGQFSVDKIINYVRKVVFTTSDIHEIAPKNTIYEFQITNKSLYNSTLLYTTFDEYGNHRFAEFNVRLTAVQEPESIAVVATHLRGDTRISMAFFQTLREYALNNGTTFQKVSKPNFQIGFEDQYLDVMSEPPTLAMFQEVDEE
jgi:hypothetical protein